ncbi:MAG: DJ-1/PfpI family protein [Candidatus Omnitrophica bacterium]|nr:DJ-1/PfpI family protein [Candidatus Omnitrophota bacterium]
MNKNALIILADGFEEIEAISVIDILRRAFIHITVCGLDNITLTGSRNIKVQADMKLDDFNEDVDALVLPGGSKGADNLSKSNKVKELILRLNQENKIIASICASPAILLAPLGILDKKSATCYPGMQDKFSTSTKYEEKDVVIDGNLITSRGPATAISFALKIVEKLTNEDSAEDIRKKLLAPRYAG